MRPQVRRIASLLFASAFLPAQIIAGCRAEVGVVEFDFRDGLIWVDVSVPGRTDPLHFVLDTGAGSTVVNRTTADELKLRLGRTITVQGAGGPGAAFTANRFRGTLAGIKLPRRVLVMDLAAVSAGCHRRIDGLIGADVLGSGSLQLDFDASVIRFGEGTAMLGAGAVVIPLRRVNDTWSVPLRVNAGPRQWVRVDTGFDGAFSWWPGQGTAGEIKATVALGRGNRQVIPVNVQVGGVHLESVEASISTRQMFPSEAGLIGNRLLSRYRVTLDFPRRRMILEPRRIDSFCK